MQPHNFESRSTPSDASLSTKKNIAEVVQQRKRQIHQHAGRWPQYHEHSLFYAASLEVSREFQVPIEMAMMTALGAISCVCQDMVSVSLPTGNTTVPSLMLLTIAKSGERKTTVQKQFFKAIMAHNREAILRHDTEMDAYKEDLYLWEIKRKETERVWKKALRDGKEEDTERLKNELLQHQHEKPVKPRSQRVLYADTTPQALVESMQNNTPSACLLTSEANSMFSGHALKDLDKINTLWDGEDVIIDRATKASFILSDSRLTLSLMAQPVVIERFITKRGEEARGIGFLARFITVMAEEKAGTRETRPIGSLDNVKRFNQRIESLIDKYFEQHNNATREEDAEDNFSSDIAWPSTRREKARKVLRFTSSATTKWFEYHREIEVLQAPNKALHYYKDHASKLMENVVRMAALLHVFEDVTGEHDQINADTLDFSYDFCRMASQHFQKHLAGIPTVVKDASSLVDHLFLKYEKEQDKIAQEEEKKGVTNPTPKKSTFNERQPYTTFSNHLPHIGVVGREFQFKLSDIKQLGPYALRGRSGHQRLMDALDFLQRMGHVKIDRFNNWIIRESLLCDSDGPEIRNGVDFTIDSLPLFAEQQFWKAFDDSHTQYDHWQIVTPNE